MNSIDAIHVRYPKPDDLPEVLRIEAEVFDDPWPSTSLLTELRHDGMRRTLIAERDRQIVGYLMAWRVDVELHIINIAVSRSAQRHGIGRCLLDHGLEDGIALGCQVATLEVRASNRSACAFYEQAGFTQRGVREGYYSDNQEDALILALEIGPVL